jgi:hypothetical protein
VASSSPRATIVTSKAMRFVFGGAAVLVIATMALAQGIRLITTLPADVMTIDTYYGQPVYDAANQRIGRLDDLLLDKDGQILVAMISVGDFLGLKRKDVAVPFAALQVLAKENKPHVVLDTDRRALREARRFAYNRAARRWEPDDE